jgi:hypothetical protein
VIEPSVETPTTARFPGHWCTIRVLALPGRPIAPLRAPWRLEHSASGVKTGRLKASVLQSPMKTASFFTYAGPGRISIARWAPPKHPAGYRVYRALAPARSMMAMSPDDFAFCYRLMLRHLDPAKVWDEMHALAGGAEPVLLCWERPPFTADNWCHRRHVAAWFGEALGVTVEEHEP